MPTEDSRAMIVSSPMASFRLERRFKSWRQAVFTLGGSGGGDGGSGFLPLIEAMGSSSDENPGSSDKLGALPGPPTKCSETFIHSRHKKLITSEMPSFSLQTTLTYYGIAL